MNHAVLFPGQGSQAVGMLAALGQAHPVVRETFDEAGAVLGWNLRDLVEKGPAEELNRTERTQPALLAAGIAVWRVWRQRAGPPTAMAGHSLGEYAALVAAGSLAFADALKLVELRGRLMQEAVPAGTGGMAAVIGLDDEAIAKLCGDCPAGVLEPANYNAPGQVVLAGQVPALEWLEANARAAGARMVVRLAMSVPSHCSLMKEAAGRLAAHLERAAFKPPEIPVLHNLDAAPRQDAGAIRAALTEQLYQPVRWTQTIQALAGQGIGLFLECGPGRVLGGLNKRIAKVSSVALEDPAALAQAVTQIKGAA